MQDKPTRNILSGGVVDLQQRARRSNFCEVHERDDFQVPLTFAESRRRRVQAERHRVF